VYCLLVWFLRYIYARVEGIWRQVLEEFFCVIIASLSIFYFIMALNYWICTEFRWFFLNFWACLPCSCTLFSFFFVSFLIEFERQRMFFSKSKDAANWKQPPILTATVGLPPLRLLPNSTREQDSSPLAWRGMWPSTKIPLGAAIPWAELPWAPKGSLSGAAATHGAEAAATWPTVCLSGIGRSWFGIGIPRRQPNSSCAHPAHGLAFY